MERQFNREDFERLLRDNANQYRMYPSEKVWKGIYSTLHTRRRWYGLSALLLLLFTVTAVTYTVLHNNERSITGISNSIASASDILANRQYNADQLTDQADQFPATPGKNTLGNRQPVFNPETDIKPLIASHLRLNAVVFNQTTTDATQTQSSINANVLVTKPSTVPHLNMDVQTPSDASANAPKEQTIIDIKKDDSKIEADTKTEEAEQKPIQDVQAEISALASQQAPIQVKGRSSKLTAQVYFTPTVSYRKLSENKAYTRAASSLNPSYQYTQYIDVNSVVNHKPAMGLELGIEGRYAITDRIAVKIGAQFNINRYDIRAYFHPTEFATIALNSGTGPDSLMTLSNYRNFNGAAPNWLENFYFTASVPLGADFIIFDNKKIQWGVSGSVQPSYVLGDRAYLISKDYKNYAKVKNLMRKMNISTDFETFISYSTGRMRWQVGPQIRYQHLSSFVNEYPVKENLFDIGLKVGATINKR